MERKFQILDKILCCSCELEHQLIRSEDLLAVVVPTFNLSTQEAHTGGSLE